MAKGRMGSSHERANRQRIDSGYAIATSASEIGAPSKAELRASIPEYDPSMIKRIEPKKPSKRK